VDVRDYFLQPGRPTRPPETPRVGTPGRSLPCLCFYLYRSSTRLACYCHKTPRFAGHIRSPVVPSTSPSVCLSVLLSVNKSWLSRQRPLRHGEQTNFRLIIYSHSSANPANLVKIGPLDVELISLTAVVNNKKQQQSGRLNYFITVANKLSPRGRRDDMLPADGNYIQ